MQCVYGCHIWPWGEGDRDVFIPRIPLIPSDMPFEFKRLQFPIKASFAMSINKAQGQSLKLVGLNLAEPAFSHGQLYVACSRAQDSKQLYMYAPNGRTKNVVYQEALQHWNSFNFVNSLKQPYFRFMKLRWKQTHVCDKNVFIVIM